MKRTTLPELIKHLTPTVVAKGVGCHPTLPGLWARGSRPGHTYAEKLVQFAISKGYNLILPRLGDPS
jgi:hypothetical protein